MSPEEKIAAMEPDLAIARVLADAHYAELLAEFQNEIPEEFRRKGDYAPSTKRCAGFTIEDRDYRFGLDFGECAMPTVAMFKFSKKECVWRLKRFMCSTAPPPFGVSYFAKTLPHAIILSRELYQQQMKAIQNMTAPQLDSGVPAGKPN